MVTVDDILKEFNTCIQHTQDDKEKCFFGFDIHFRIHFDNIRKCWVLTKISNPLYNSNLTFGINRRHFLRYISESRNENFLNSAKDYSVFSACSPQLGVIRDGEVLLVQVGNEGFFDINNRPEEQVAHGTLTDDALSDIKDLCLFTQGTGTSCSNFGVYLYPKENKWSVLDIFLELQRKIKNISDLYADLSVRALDGANGRELALMLNDFVIDKEPLPEINIKFSRDLLFVPSSTIMCLPDKTSYCYWRIFDMGCDTLFKKSYYSQYPKFSVAGGADRPPYCEYMCLPVNGVDKNKIYIEDNILDHTQDDIPLALVVDSAEYPSFIRQVANKDVESINYTKYVNTQLFVRLVDDKGLSEDVLIKDYNNPCENNLGFAEGLLNKPTGDLVFTIKSRVEVNRKQKEQQLETKIIQLDKSTGRFLLCPRKN